MKKRILIIITLLLSNIASYAALHWTPSSSGFESKMPTYIKLELNGVQVTASDAVEIAAFIDGECRASSATVSQIGTSANYQMELNVLGNVTADAGKTVVFKAFYDNVEYDFSKTITWTEETQSYPVVFSLISLDTYSALSLPESISLDGTKTPADNKNLLSELSVTYTIDQTSITKKYGELDSYPEVSWSQPEGTDSQVSVAENGVVTAVSSTDLLGVTVMATIGTNSATTKVLVTPLTYIIRGVGFSEAEEDIISIEVGQSIDVAPYVRIKVVSGFDSEENETYSYIKLSDFPEGQEPELVYNVYAYSDAEVTGSTVKALERTTTDGDKLEVVYYIPETEDYLFGETRIYFTPFIYYVRDVEVSDFEVNLTVDGTYQITVNPIPAQAELEDLGFIVTPLEGTELPEGWYAVIVSDIERTTSEQGENSYKVTLKGCHLGDYNLYFTLWGGEIWGDMEDTPILAHVGASYELASGWNWTSFYSVSEEINTPAKLNTATGDKLVDLRSQTQSTYKDDTYGFFGSLESMNNNTAYMVKLDGEASVVSYGGLQSEGTLNCYNKWTWMYYPYQYDNALDDVMGSINFEFEAGDKIVGLDSQAEYSADGEWVGTLSTLEAGKAYKLYMPNGAGNTITWPDETDFGQPDYGPIDDEPDLISSSRTNTWTYNEHAYRDNMSVIARLEAPDNTTIGAFVNGECRGTGKMVENDGKKYYFITVHGETGETVTFKAFDGIQYYDIDSELKFNLLYGSLKEPVELGNVANTTGIRNIQSEDYSDQILYDLNGRVAGKDAHGVLIIKKNGIVSKVVK